MPSRFVVCYTTRDGVHADLHAYADGERVMFEIVLHVCATRRGTSNYFGCDYRQIQPCPHCVAEAGMDIYGQIKHLLRRARKEKNRKERAG